MVEAVEENFEAYLRTELRSFADFVLGDADLLAFAALVYAEFERFEGFVPGAPGVPLGKLRDYADLHEYVEHDYAPATMQGIVSAMVESPRFAPVELQRFRCIVDEERVIQFAAACFPVTPELVVIAYRGTDAKLVGWAESLNLSWQAEGPGEAEALRYFEEALDAYPQAQFVLCGHSKGGAEAEHVAVFCDNANLARIARAVSFDGPALTRCGGAACPEFDGHDELIAVRYAQLPFPVIRYITPAAVGLLMENGDPYRHRYTECTVNRPDHGAGAMHIVDGRIVVHEPEPERIAMGLAASRFLLKMPLSDRRFLCELAIAAFHRAGTPGNVTDVPTIARAIVPLYLAAPLAEKRTMLSIAQRFLAAQLLPSHQPEKNG